MYLSPWGGLRQSSDLKYLRGPGRFKYSQVQNCLGTYCGAPVRESTRQYSQGMWGSRQYVLQASQYRSSTASPGQSRPVPILPHGATRHSPRRFGAWALNLDFLNSRQRLGQTLNLLRFRVRLNEYYNFGRIEPGRHGCFFGIENGLLRSPIIMFSRCAALVKAAPYGARGNLH